MNFLVDSKTILDFFNGKSELFNLFDNTENIYVSVITIGELNSKASKIESQKDIVSIANDFCSLLHIVNIDEEIAKKYGELKSSYSQIEDNLLWLCATAIVKDFVLITENSKVNKISHLITKTF